MRSCLLAIEWIPQASCPEKKLLRAGGVDGGASTGTALKIHAPALDRRWGPADAAVPTTSLTHANGKRGSYHSSQGSPHRGSEITSIGWDRMYSRLRYSARARNIAQEY